MPNCSLCGTETILFVNGVPLCLKCDDGGTAKAPGREHPKIGAIGLAELADGLIYLICPFCGFSSQRPFTTTPAEAVCDHCNPKFPVAEELDISAGPEPCN